MYSQPPFGLPEVEHVDHVRVVDANGGFGLPEEPVPKDFADGVLGLEHLERDRTPRADHDALVHVAHRAGADLAAHVVPAIEDPADQFRRRGA